MPLAMFWKFDLITSSHLEALLDKEDVTLSELLDEDDVLQECKAQNRRSDQKTTPMNMFFSPFHIHACVYVHIFFLISKASPVPVPGPVHAGAGPLDHNRASCWHRRYQAIQVGVWVEFKKCNIS